VRHFLNSRLLASRFYPLLHRRMNFAFMSGAKRSSAPIPAASACH
jgi:hypothetical protein